MTALEDLRAAVYGVRALDDSVAYMCQAAVELRDHLEAAYGNSSGLDRDWRRYAPEDAPAAMPPAHVIAGQTVERLAALIESAGVVRRALRRARVRLTEIERKNIWMLVHDNQAVPDGTNDGVYWIQDGKKRVAGSEEKAVALVREKMAAEELAALKDGFTEAGRVLAACREEPGAKGPDASTDPRPRRRRSGYRVPYELGLRPGPVAPGPVNPRNTLGKYGKSWVKTPGCTP
ncbi:MAG: hypothetical protein LBJ02_11710 [Bifidobacteriaceae bacterium]|nr:hypothetical protein [Bifidobacteriaceae bacterium]